MSDTDAFDKAKFYDCEDSEELSHEDPEEAILDWLNNWLIPTMGDPATVIKIIAEHTPITVTAYNPEVVTDAWCEMVAESIAEDIHDRFDDDPDAAPADRYDLETQIAYDTMEEQWDRDFGGEDGNSQWDDDTRAEGLPALRPHVAAIVDTVAESLAAKDGREFEPSDLAPLAATIRALIDKQRVWQCTPVGKRTYSTEEVLTLARRENPDWFEEYASE